jgi:hypothetical protein
MDKEIDDEVDDTLDDNDDGVDINAGAEGEEDIVTPVKKLPRKPSRISKLFAALPPIPEYPIAKPVETEDTEEDETRIEPGFGDVDDDKIDDLIGVEDDDMDDMVGTSGVIEDDVSDITDLDPRDADWLYGTGPEEPRVKKVKYSAGGAGSKRVKSKDYDTYMSGML